MKMKIIGIGGPGNRYAETFIDNSLVAGDQTGEEVAAEHGKMVITVNGAAMVDAAAKPGLWLSMATTQLVARNRKRPGGRR